MVDFPMSFLIVYVQEQDVERKKKLAENIFSAHFVFLNNTKLLIKTLRHSSSQSMVETCL